MHIMLECPCNAGLYQTTTCRAAGGNRHCLLQLAQCLGECVRCACVVQELVLSQSAYLGRQIEIIAAFSVDANASTGNSTAQSPFAVGLQLNTGNGTYTRISINGTGAASQTGGLQIFQVSISHLGAPTACIRSFVQITCQPRKRNFASPVK